MYAAAGDGPPHLTDITGSRQPAIKACARSGLMFAQPEPATKDRISAPNIPLLVEDDAADDAARLEQHQRFAGVVGRQKGSRVVPDHSYFHKTQGEIALVECPGTTRYYMLAITRLNPVTLRFQSAWK